MGSTAVNDDLQDDLEEDLDFFFKTGIRIWILTGDNFYPAKSVALSSKIFTENNQIYEFNNIKNKEELKKKLEESLLKLDEIEGQYLKKKYKEFNKENKEKSLDIPYDSRPSFMIQNVDSTFISMDIKERIKHSLIIGADQLQIILNSKNLKEKVRNKTKKIILNP